MPRYELRTAHACGPSVPTRKPLIDTAREFTLFRVLTGHPTPSPPGPALGYVDNRSEVREFLISRRAKITPQQAGLPAHGGRRRVAGLRREEVALLAGVSVEYYARLERGNLSGVSESVLEALARALQLDEAEHAHLFDLARTANTGPRTRRRPARQQIRPASSGAVRRPLGCPSRSITEAACRIRPQPDSSTPAVVGS